MDHPYNARQIKGAIFPHISRFSSVESSIASNNTVDKDMPIFLRKFV